MVWVLAVLFGAVLVMIILPLALRLDMARVLRFLTLAVLFDVVLVLAVESKRACAAVNFLSHKSMAYIFLPGVENLACRGRNQH